MQDKSSGIRNGPFARPIYNQIGELEVSITLILSKSDNSSDHCDHSYQNQIIQIAIATIFQTQMILLP